jgi:hypothetical protein
VIAELATVKETQNTKLKEYIHTTHVYCIQYVLGGYLLIKNPGLAAGSARYLSLGQDLNAPPAILSTVKLKASGAMRPF